MINENAQKWLDALRSGHYEQYRHNLLSRDGGAYCCLGVACRDLQARDGDGYWTMSSGSAGWKFIATKSIGNTQLPRDVIEWLGIRNSTGKFDTPFEPENENEREVTSLLKANDKGGYDFPASRTL